MNSLYPNRWPVKWRIAAVSAGLTLLILLGFAFVVGRLAVDKLEANFREEAQSTANDLANRFEIKTNPAGGRVLGSRGAALEELVLPVRSAFRIVNANGELFGQPEIGSLGASSPDPRVPSEKPENIGKLTVASQEIPSNTFGEPVYAQYLRSRSSLNSTIDRLWLFLGCGVLVGTALALLAGLAVAGRAMRPISSLTAAAREVATTRDPSRRLPMPETEDEVAELAQTLDEMLRQLDAAHSETEQMVQVQREFVADASHELRTPLTSIHANLELLQARLDARGDEADGEDGEIVAGALGSSKRMRRLVSDLLLLARAGTGRAGPRGACDLAEIAEAAIAEVRTVADDRSLSLTADGTFTVECNPDDVHRLVVNLVENAVRHTPPMTEVLVSVRSDDGAAVVEIEDDGPGLPEGLGEQIFARFVRGTGQADLSTDSGTGLGLAIVKAVAVAHGGSVEAGRSPHGGARFTVRLPLAKEGAAAPGEGDKSGARPVAGAASEPRVNL